MSIKYWFSFTPDPRTSANLSPTFLSFIKYDGTTLTPPGITQPISGSGLYQFTYTPTFSISWLIDGATTGGGLTTAIRYVSGALDPIDRLDELLSETGSTLQALGNTGIALGVTGVAIGTSNIALGTTAVALGTTAVAIGTSGIALGTTAVALGTSLIAQGISLAAQGVSILSYLTGSNAAIGSTASVYGGSAADPVDLFGYLKRIQEFLEGNQTFDKSTGGWSIYSRGGATLLISKNITNAATGVTRI